MNRFRSALAALVAMAMCRNGAAASRQASYKLRGHVPKNSEPKHTASHSHRKLLPKSSSADFGTCTSDVRQQTFQNVAVGEVNVVVATCPVNTMVLDFSCDIQQDGDAFELYNDLFEGTRLLKDILFDEQQLVARAMLCAMTLTDPNLAAATATLTATVTCGRKEAFPEVVLSELTTFKEDTAPGAHRSRSHSCPEGLVRLADTCSTDDTEFFKLFRSNGLETSNFCSFINESDATRSFTMTNTLICGNPNPQAVCDALPSPTASLAPSSAPTVAPTCISRPLTNLFQVFNHRNSRGNVKNICPGGMMLLDYKCKFEDEGKFDFTLKQDNEFIKDPEDGDVVVGASCGFSSSELIGPDEKPRVQDIFVTTTITCGREEEFQDVFLTERVALKSDTPSETHRSLRHTCPSGTMHLSDSCQVDDVTNFVLTGKNSRNNGVFCSYTNQSDSTQTMTMTNSLLCGIPSNQPRDVCLL